MAQNHTSNATVFNQDYLDDEDLNPDLGTLGDQKSKIDCSNFIDNVPLKIPTSPSGDEAPEKIC